MMRHNRVRSLGAGICAVAAIGGVLAGGAGSAHAQPATGVSVNGSIVTVTATFDAASVGSSTFACVVVDHGKTIKDDGAVVSPYVAMNLTTRSVKLTTKTLPDGKHQLKIMCSSIPTGSKKLTSSIAVAYVGLLGPLYEVLDKSGSSSLIP